MNKWKFLILFGIVFFAWGCLGERKTIDKNTRQLVETLAKKRMIELDSSIQIACDSVYNDWLAYYTDSLYQMRRHEIQSIRTRQVVPDINSN